MHLLAAVAALGLSLGAANPVPSAAPPADAAPLSAEELRRALDPILARGALGLARTGVAVLSLDTGALLYGRDPDALLNPASNVKLFTTAAALLRLGPAYRFETEIWSVASGERGAARSLTVKGKGDPTLTTERLWALAAEIQLRGIAVVKGDLLVDESFFDGEAEAPGYDQESGDRAYLAPTGAASLNWNTVQVHVGPGARPGEKARVLLEPASDHLVLVNRVTTGPASARGRIEIHSRPSGGRQEVVVEGRIAAGARDQALWRKVEEPGLYLGHTLRRLLELRGVKVHGKVRRAPVPAEARLLAVAESEPLADVVRRLNKTSNNFMAEQLLKTLGAEAKGAPGSFAKGVQAGEEALAELGLVPGTYVWKNGSGLNDTNRFSARQTAALLRAVWRRFPLASEFVGSLPVAGRDGTIRWRLEGSPAEGRLRAKTGTLDGVTGLSGYVEAASGERLAFAIFVNDHAGRAGPVVRGVDQLAGQLALLGRGQLPAPGAAGSAAAGGTSGAGPAGGAAPLRLAAGPVDAAATSTGLPGAAPDGAEGARARVATYYGLGLAADRRNVPFLRTALRTEPDPVVRMAAAEAVYLSDPASAEARRVFLDGLALDRASLLRLRELVGSLDLAAPVLGSLADLAAEGGADALSRLLELGAAVAGEPALEAPYAEVLGEVARSAPEELAAARERAAAEARYMTSPPSTSTQRPSK